MAPREAFRRLVSLALVEQVDFVVLAGDIFDGAWRDMSTGLFFAAELRRLGTIPVYITRGNHDAESRVLKGLPLPSNVTLFGSTRPETKVLEHIGVAIHGQSFSSHNIPDDLAAKYPMAIGGMRNVALLHTSLGGYQEHAVYAPTSVSVLQSKGYDYWALGHVHRRQVVAGNTLIVYPGNIQGRHIQECGAKGCMLVSDVDGPLSIEFKALDVIRWADLEVDVSEAQDADDAAVLALEQIGEHVAAEAGGRPICCRVTFVGGTKAHADLVRRSAEVELRLRTDAPDHDVWVAGLRVHTRLPVDSDTLEKDDGLVGDLIRTLERLREDPEKRDDTLARLAPLIAKVPTEVVKIFKTSFDDDAGFDEMLAAAKAELIARLFQR
jgi:DNA repair exonuclease SbcCD nuclease subunit